MPFKKWAVQPVYLCRSNETNPEKKYASDFDSMCQRSLISGLHQLASVARLADKIFDELIGECRLTIERTERLRLKLEVCEDVVSKLNARSVKVPVSDFNTTFKFLRQHKPYQTLYGMPTQLFLPSNRPPCIDTLYNGASVTPVSVICTIDKYRTDGRTSSELFMVTPVLGGATRKKRKRMLDIETRRPANFSLATEQESQELGISEDEVSVPQVAVAPSIRRETKSLERLPSPEEQAMAISLEYPSTLVPVDTSGSNFIRMIKSRRSLLHADFVIKTKKDKKKSKRRHTVCEGSSKELQMAIQNITMVNSSCQTEELQETGSFFSLRRRSFCRKKSKRTDSTRRETIALDSLNLDSFRNNNSTDALSDEIKPSKKDSANGNKIFGKASSLMSKAANFNPISSLSAAALSIAVKMRHSKSGKHDDGRSSSGNWSASSSTRASMDSDHHHIGVIVDRISNVSRNSAGKDSVISDATQQDSVRSQELNSNPAHSLKLSNRLTFEKSGRHQWDIERERGRDSNNSTPERSSDCASTPLIMSPYIGRRHQNFPPTSFDDGESSVYSVDTDGYYTSMHTDSGLCHNVIQNIRNGDNIYNDVMRCRRRRESQSSVSTVDNSSLNSFLSKNVTESSSSNGSSTQHPKLAPEPPPRTISYLEKIVPSHKMETFKEVNVQTDFDKESSPTKNGSASESDHEACDRIRVKTTINSSRYPSICAVSPETSDDDELSDIEKAKTANVSVVVAEVHREEKIEEPGQRNKNPESPSRLPAQMCGIKGQQHFINMYGCQSPPSSPFESGLLHENCVTASTPKSVKTISSFAVEQDTVDSKSTKIGYPDRRELSPNLELDTKDISSIENNVIVSNSPRPPKSMAHNSEQTLIPLKYAQRITVTPIIRSETSDRSSPKLNSPTTRSKSFLKNPLSNLSFLQTESPKSKSPSYISFQSPDSPVSSSTSLSPSSPINKSLPISRAVARVTLDPLGKVIYSSSSLDRHKREVDSKNSTLLSENDRHKYATLPKYQCPTSRLPTLQTNHEEKSIQRSVTPNHTSTPQNSVSQKPFPQIINSNHNNNSSSMKPQNLFFRPSRGGRFCRTYFPPHLISSSPKATNNQEISSPPSPCSPTKSVFLSSSQSNFNTELYGQQQHNNNTSENLENKTVVTATQLRPSSRPVSSPIRHQSSPSFHQSNKHLSDFQNLPSHHAIVSSSPTQNSFSSMQTRNLNQFSPTTPYQHQYRAMHFPQEMCATATSLYTTSVQQPMYNNLKSPSPTLFYSSRFNKPIYNENNDKNNEMTKSPLTELTPSNPPDVIPSSSTPPSTLDITSRIIKKNEFSSPQSDRSPVNNNLKSMTSKELFDVIHDSKKRHNIKTDSEKSISPFSSRSSSPSILLTPSPIKSPRVETGTFIKQSDRLTNVEKLNLNSPGRSPTQERLTRSKPTSMHDFKMLLLQTRIGSADLNSRPSAAELLKVSPPKASPSPQNVNKPIIKSPSSPVSLVGHIPVKRNFRTRSPYLTRFDSAYPPIWEDCSEGLEEADENQNDVNYTIGSQDSAKKGIYTSNSQNMINNSLNSKSSSTWV